jgi:prepilin-type N-terminal cleavage/methylation domain-containing protein
MNLKRSPFRKVHGAFTFLEIIIVIAVIGIMSALAISSFSNGANDAREIVARQQQATIQGAVNAWVAAQTAGNGTVSETRTVYNAGETSLDRLELVRAYLDETSYEHFVAQSASDDSGEVLSESVRRLGWHINLPTWQGDSYPKVELVRAAP